jgi:hypothetical protein
VFGVFQQLDHQFADVFIQKVMLERGKGQEPRPCNDVNAIRCTAQADERRVHLPFGGRIEEGKFLILLNIFACIHQQVFCIKNHIGVTGMVQRCKLADICMPVAVDLNGIAIRFVDDFFCGNFTNDLTLFIGLLCDQTPEFIFSLDHKRIHCRCHFTFLSFTSVIIL